MKKIGYILIFFALVSCGFEPIYSKKNSYNISLNNYTLQGDKDINRKLVSIINSGGKNQKSIAYDLILTSNKSIEVVAKDSLGNASVYKTVIQVDFILKNVNDVGKVFKAKTIVLESSYNSMKNKFDLLQYQKNIENNLINKLSQEIKIFMDS